MKGATGLSALTAVLTGAGAYLLLFLLQVDDALVYALLAAALVYLILSAVLRIYHRQLQKRYAQHEQALGLTYYHKTNGNFDLGNGNVKNGNIYLCEDKLVCLGVEETPYALDEILKADIARMDAEDIHLRIMTWDGRRFIITMPDAQAALQLLRDRGW